jgi:hypothetical protein
MERVVGKVAFQNVILGVGVDVRWISQPDGRMSLVEGRRVFTGQRNDFKSNITVLLAEECSWLSGPSANKDAQDQHDVIEWWDQRDNT